MKNQVGIWIDGSKALVIDINQEKEAIRIVESDIENRVHHRHQGKKGTFMGTHHVNNERKFDERKKHQVDQFLNKVIKELKDADELFIMGPSELKTTLRTKIQANRQLSSKLKGIEAADHMTLNQCVEKVKKFYLS